jgi:putative selenate reductase
VLLFAGAAVVPCYRAAAGGRALVLRPHPFGALVRRALRELEVHDSVFDLPARRFVLSPRGRDLSVVFHDRRVATPYGPAAGPHTQLAQNIVLAWLGGARIIELKTVQVRDDLVIPRPCIDMQTIGYNVEWSQELRLEQSLEEYVKASMLVQILAASPGLGVARGFASPVFDMSVGYDLAGLTSDRVQAFLRGMLDAGPVVTRLRTQVPEEYRQFRDLDFPARVADTLTLSTFHGCPPDEIEAMADFLMRAYRLHVVVKLNPTLLGHEDTTALLRQLGYDELRVPKGAFARDATWLQMCGLVERLGATARSLGLGFGVKLTNTLIVENHRHFLPASEREMYLSGQPLHVLAIELLRRFRRRFGDEVPVSFSAGIDRGNFAEAVALGLVPVTVCSDLLRPGGYGRAYGYFQALDERMARVAARDIDELVLRGHGQARAALDRLAVERHVRDCALQALSDGTSLRDAVDEVTFRRWRSEAVLLNTEAYADRVLADPRYGRAATARPPRKIGRHLRLLDCLTCDKCIPVCPNDANFTFAIPTGEFPVVVLTRRNGAWEHTVEGVLPVTEPRQIGTFLDFCNACGNCDVFCPEDGGPYAVKPHFFGSERAWREAAPTDGFYITGSAGSSRVLGRIDGREYAVSLDGPRARYRGEGFSVAFDVSDPPGTVDGDAPDGTTVDLSRFELMRWFAEALLAPGAVNYVSCLEGPRH